MGTPPKKAPPSPGADRKDTVSPAAEAQFVAGLLARGEAVPAAEGELTPSATHEITGVKPDGQPEVKRRRFSAR